MASRTVLSARTAHALRCRLLAWFRRHQRDLPWRHDRDPYHIWVSEIMLQQTQVTTVIPYFERFLKAFPTITDLAAAKEQQVLRLWEGLGYYRRARYLHQAAQRLARDHGGLLPDDPEVIRSLPGIGRYTLGAILSQAFDRRWPAVDGNVARVLCRWFAWHEEPRSPSSQAWLWQMAEALLPQDEASDWNQALMKLGALVCTPHHPQCRACPVKPHCEAHRRGLVSKIPTNSPPSTSVSVREVAIVLRRGRRALLLQRLPDADRWAGMWEFPRGEHRRGESSQAACQRVAQELTGLQVRPGSRLTTIKHGVTRFAITMDAYTAEAVGGRLRAVRHTQGRWFTAGQLESLPLAAPQRLLARSAFAVVS